ncbi:MAG TPA: universal stress protein [Paludibacter sp.]|nr:universal stress protein [Paludibacter sp.]
MKTVKIKKVVIALDYDETAQKVAETGFSVAKAMNAHVILLHAVYEKPAYYSAYSYVRDLSVDVIDDLKKSTLKFLEKTKKHLGDDDIETIVTEGIVSDVILKTAKEEKADMIVMGSHSRKWLENILMGSDAEDVLKKTTIPLFIVPTRKQE